MPVNQLKAGAVISFLTFGAANILGLLYTPFMLRMMGQEEYGLYSLVASVVSYLTMLDFGFGNAIIRYTAKYRTEKRENELPILYGMFTFLYGIIGIVALGGGSLLFLNIDNIFGKTMTDVELYKMRIMMGLLVFNVVFTFAMSVWRNIPVAYERFIFSKSVNLARMLLNPLVMVILLYMGYKAIALVVVTTLFNMLTLCADVWYCKRKLNIEIRLTCIRWNFVREVGAYSFWIFLGVIVERIYWSSGQFILGMNVGSSAVAVYAIAIQLAYIYMGLGSFLWSMMLPKVTTMAVKENYEAISDLFVRSCRLQYIILLFVLVIFTVFGKAFITIWAGNGYEHAFPITLMFFAALLFPYAQNMGAVVAQARNSVRPYALIRLFTSLLGLALSAYLSHRFTDIGCAIGTLMALLLQTLLLNVFYSRYLSIKILRFWKEVLKVSIIPILCCIVGYQLFAAMKWQHLGTLILGIGTFTVVFAIICWKLSLNDYERSIVTQPVLTFLRNKRRR